MKIRNITHYIPDCQLLCGSLESEIDSIAYDSRKVTVNSLFAAIKGHALDGHVFINDAIQRGASCILGENISPEYFHENVTFINVPDARKALAQAARLFYQNPGTFLTTVGITGTNGKTTTCHIVKSIIEAQNVKAGLSGTIHNLIGDRTVPASHTTPESLDLQKLLREMVDEGCTYAVIEVSSHALALNRLDGCTFNSAAFTNFSRDHLDFHHTPEEYFLSKLRIFDYLSRNSHAVINVDDPLLRDMVETLSCPVITCGTHNDAMIKAEEVSLTGDSLFMKVLTPEGRLSLTSPLVGRTNVENILLSIGIAYGLGIAPEAVEKGIREVKPVAGRFEQVVIGNGSRAVIDYAHTDEALRRVLIEARAITHKRLITVFGCGGNRDKGKRPLMGRAASELSDLVIITSDNPRNEDPQDIINDIIKGIKGNHYVIITDRREAINKALTMADSGDTVVIAGKGHEDYQEIKGIRYTLSDRGIVREFLEKVEER